MDLELIRNDTSLAENTYNNDVYVRDDEWLKYVWLCLLKVRTWPIHTPQYALLTLTVYFDMM